MLDPGLKLALFMEGALDKPYGKMGFGVLRYSPNPIVAVVDSAHAGVEQSTVTGVQREVPVVGTVQEAIERGAEALILGIAPPGGAIPSDWLPAIDLAVRHGLTVVNGLHDRLAPRYPDLRPGQLIWDVRVEPEGLGTGSGAARLLTNRRLLLVGTDMAIGKMTAGLEIWKAARDRGVSAGFVATGQIGITITGAGVPLDAVRLDFASGAIEREVMALADRELVVVEGQGSLANPASSANLPLMRGAMPTHLVMCHRAGQTSLMRMPEIAIPPLRELISLNEALSGGGGAFPAARCVAVALNTAHLVDDHQVRAAIDAVEHETGLPCVDPVRHGAGRLLDAVLA